MKIDRFSDSDTKAWHRMEVIKDCERKLLDLDKSMNLGFMKIIGKRNEINFSSDTQVNHSNSSRRDLMIIRHTKVSRRNNFQ